MAKQEFRCNSGNTYTCHLPDLTVFESRARLELLRERAAGQVRLANRVKLIDRFYDDLAAKGEITDLDEMLGKLDQAAERSRVATEELAAYVAEKLDVEFFCDGIDEVPDFAQLPVADANELYDKCRAVVMGRDPNPPSQAG